MKSKVEPHAKKRNRIIRLFLQVITYRIPLPVTKVIVYGDDTAYPICPRCATSLEREYMGFCDRCGQKLGWKCFAHARVVRPGLRRK